MSVFSRAEKPVEDMAKEVLKTFDTHKPLVTIGLRIDFVEARAELDDEGHPSGPALKLHGVAALGIAKIIPPKDRALGRGDAEIAFDGDWWIEASDEQRRALLDHELHHLALVADKFGNVKRDYLDRPKLRMRKHDFDFGWFSIIAVRHGVNSVECHQAKAIMDNAGQFYWPDMTNHRGQHLDKKAA
jgi:hypothetical protein